MADNDKSLVKNAADRDQVSKAGEKTKLAQEQEVSDLKFLLKQPQFRRYIWRLLSFCSVFESIWHPSALIHANAGRQDVGHKIMGEVIEADDESFLTMMRESKEKNNG